MAIRSKPSRWIPRAPASIPVGEGLVPLDDYYLWCDHRAKNEAAEITELAHKEKLEAIQWCGGVYSSEWGFAKLLHWLRHNPGQAREVRHRLRALRHGRGHAVRHHESGGSKTQHLRDGPQVDVESPPWADCLRKVFWRSRSAAGGRAREDWRESTRPRTKLPGS